MWPSEKAVPSSKEKALWQWLYREVMNWFEYLTCVHDGSIREGRTFLKVYLIQFRWISSSIVWSNKRKIAQCFTTQCLWFHALWPCHYYILYCQDNCFLIYTVQEKRKQRDNPPREYHFHPCHTWFKKRNKYNSSTFFKKLLSVHLSKF